MSYNLCLGSDCQNLVTSEILCSVCADDAALCRLDLVVATLLASLTDYTATERAWFRSSLGSAS